VNSRLRRLSDLRQLAGQVTSSLGREPVSGSANVHKLDGTIAKIVDMECEINEEIDRLVDAKREAMAVIRQVKHPDQQLVLELRYLDFKSWPSIAEEMGLSTRWVQTLHERALATVENIFSQKT
ncbi:DUF1492 domain-containing protein, partial [Selenomonas bovis]|uniref:DUF1492 domain-containing protein n=1 Tax=Selenomonas bovis TaxID=416586 RepID=UPI0003600580